jgi:hypothetical protein
MKWFGMVHGTKGGFWWLASDAWIASKLQMEYDQIICNSQGSMQ